MQLFCQVAGQHFCDFTACDFAPSKFFFFPQGSKKFFFFAMSCWDMKCVFIWILFWISKLDYLSENRDYFLYEHELLLKLHNVLTLACNSICKLNQVKNVVYKEKKDPVFKVTMKFLKVLTNWTVSTIKLSPLFSNFTASILHSPSFHSWVFVMISSTYRNLEESHTLKTQGSTWQHVSITSSQLLFL